MSPEYIDPVQPDLQDARRPQNDLLIVELDERFDFSVGIVDSDLDGEQNISGCTNGFACCNDTQTECTNYLACYQCC